MIVNLNKELKINLESEKDLKLIHLQIYRRIKLSKIIYNNRRMNKSKIKIKIILIFIIKIIIK